MSKVADTWRDGLPTGIDVAGFLQWLKVNPGRYELHNGEIFATSPARNRHGVAKFAIQRPLLDAVRQAELSCHVMPDGAAVYVSDYTWYEPDALVYCGPEAPGDDITVDNPVIIVEVVSPSTGALDAFDKLIGYFTVASVQHYLIVHPQQRRLIHHARQADGTILTAIRAAGPLRLDPPGLSVDLAEVLG